LVQYTSLSIFKAIVVTILSISTSSWAQNQCVCPTSDDDLSTLKSLMRHGIRAPWTTYPLDPFAANNSQRFPNGGSQLTDAGIDQAYNMGRYYKQRYGKFIDENPKSAFLRASAAQRCIDTLSIVAKKLWPPAVDNKKQWQPMIFSLPQKIDSILYEEPDCEHAEEEEQKNLKTPEVQAYEADPKIQELYKFTKEKTGLKADMYSVTKAFDCIRCEKLNGLQSPDWATPEIYDRMGDVLSNRLNFFYKSTKAQRLRAGPILEDFKTNMDNVINAKATDKPKKVYIYTSHDFKIASVLSALGDPQPKYPPFAAALILELHKIGDKNIVRALYVDQTVNWPYTAIKLPLTKCQVKAGPGAKDCTFENFVNSIADLTPVDWRSECGLDCKYDPFKSAEDNLGQT
ncbi:unnamed protein product, partial [Oppiella nova]